MHGTARVSQTSAVEMPVAPPHLGNTVYTHIHAGAGLTNAPTRGRSSNNQLLSSCEQGEGEKRFYVSLCHIFVNFSQNYFAAGGSSVVTRVHLISPWVL